MLEINAPSRLILYWKRLGIDRNAHYSYTKGRTSKLLGEARLLKYFKKRRKEKLYRQWVERAGLPPEAVPAGADKPEDVPLQVHSAEAVSPEAHEPLKVHVEPDSRVATHPEITGDMMAEINKRQLRLPLLHMLLGASALILFVGLILLIVYSC